MRFCRKMPALFKWCQWQFHEDNEPVHNSILVTHYLTKMGIKTVPTLPIVQTLLPVTFANSLSSEAVVHYETIEEMKEAVTKLIDMIIPEDFHGAFQKLLERYNKCISAGGDFFEGD